MHVQYCEYFYFQIQTVRGRYLQSFFIIARDHDCDCRITIAMCNGHDSSVHLTVAKKKRGIQKLFV